MQNHTEDFEFQAAVSTLQLGLTLAENGDITSSLDLLQDARSTLIHYPQAPELSEALTGIATVLTYRGEFVESLPYAAEALRLLDGSYVCKTAYLNRLMGSNYQRLENFELAAEHYGEAAHAYSKTNHFHEQIEVGKTLAFCLTKIGRRDEAREALNEVIELCRSHDLPGHVHTVGEMHYLLGSSFYNEQEFEQAKLNYMIAQNIFNGEQNRESATHCIEALAHIANAEDRLDLAVELFFEAAWNYDEEGCFEDSERASTYHQEVLELLLKP